MRNVQDFDTGRAHEGERPTRAGGGNGRVYTIFFTATDGRGASCQGSVRVSVPHDRGRAAVDDGPVYDSTACSWK